MGGILGTQNGIGFFLSITEETELIVNSVYDCVLEAEYERIFSLIDIFESWD